MSPEEGGRGKQGRGGAGLMVLDRPIAQGVGLRCPGPDQRSPVDANPFAVMQRGKLSPEWGRVLEKRTARQWRRPGTARSPLEEGVADASSVHPLWDPQKEPLLQTLLP